MSFHNRRWIFLDSDNLSGVDFNQVLETSAETLRYSMDSGMFFVKYNVTEVSGVEYGRPDCYDLAVEISGKTEWGHEDVLEYLATPDWTPTGIM